MADLAVCHEENELLASSANEESTDKMLLGISSDSSANGVKEEIVDQLEAVSIEGRHQTHVTFQIPPSTDSPKISPNMTVNSEYIARASTMRTKIEEKITDIEKKMDLPALDSSSESIDKEWSPADYNLIKVLDPKRSRSCSVSEMRQNTIDRLQSKLEKAEKDLELREEEVQRLRKIRDEVGSEIEDLTASLFEV